MGGRGTAANRAGFGGSGEGSESSAGGGEEAIERDEQTAALFNGKFTVEGYDADAKAYMRQVFGRNVSAQEIGRMVGAPDGAVVTIDYSTGAHRLKNENFEISVEHPFIDTMERYIYKAGGEVVIKNSLFYMKKDANDKNIAPAGFGTRVFAQQAQSARASGVNYLKTYATRSDPSPDNATPENGYYSWARMGYNAPLSERMQARTLGYANLRGAKTLNQLMARGGASLWKEHGEGSHMVFSLDRGSTSFRVLNSYLRSRGIKTGRRTPKK